MEKNMESSLIKPFLAKDVNEDKLEFPSTGLIVQMKIDGSFSMIQNNKLYARSLKPHENLYVTQQFSKVEYEGLRGEMILGDNPTAEGLCRNTSSALRTVSGEPQMTLWCFDYVTHETKDLPYIDRYNLMKTKVLRLNDPKIRFVQQSLAYDKESYESKRNMFLELGYEGCILRDPQTKHKEGRSSAVKPELWRMKPWSSAEIRVDYLVEEMKNNNAAKTNELGHIERSSHKENLECKDTMGAIVGTLVTPILDYKGKVIAPVGKHITISTGCLTTKDCKYYWDNQGEILNNIVEFEYMSYGLKEDARFAQFKRIRPERDM